MDGKLMRLGDQITLETEYSESFFSPHFGRASRESMSTVRSLAFLYFSHSVGRGFKKYSRAACILSIFQISWFIYKAHENSSYIMLYLRKKTLKKT